MKLGKTGALRIYSVNIPSAAEKRNLVNLHLGHEDLLYQIAHSSQRGRSLTHKKAFAIPLSRLMDKPGTTGSPELSNRRYGVNSHQGNLEFRYFDSSLKAAPVQANVALVLGMVAAARDGKLQDVAAHPVRWYNRFLPSANRWNRFIKETVGEGPVADQLARQR